MIDIVLLSQGIPSYQHIETGIRRALDASPLFRAQTVSLSDAYSEAKRGQPKATHAELLRLAAPVVLERLLAAESETVLLLNGYVLENNCPGFFERLHSSGKRLVAWQIDDPYYIDLAPRFIRHVDVVLTVDASALPVYDSLGVRCAYLPLGFDSAVHKPLSTFTGDDKTFDISFIGTPFKGSQRVAYIDELGDLLPQTRALIAGKSAIDSWSDNLRNHAALASCIRDTWVDHAEAARIFASTSINLNLH